MAGIIMLPFASTPSRDIQSSLTPTEAIESDYLKGNITADERALHIIQAIKTPNKLPLSYQQQNSVGSGKATRCVSMVLREILQDFELLSPTTQAIFQTSLARYDTDSTFYSPGGFFKLHYNLAPDSNGVPSDDADFSGIPDFIEKCAAYCDSSNARHLELGYLPPPPDGVLGGDDKLDVYFQEMSPYGYVLPEGNGPEPWDDAYGYMVLNNDFLGFDPNDDPEGSQWGAAKVTIAHEYHHLVQYAYDSGEERWSMELNAVFMEEIVFDESNDCYNYLDEFFSYPLKSLMENSTHYYSCFPWELYLAQKFDTSLMLAAWEGARYAPTVFEALEDTLLGRYGWTLDSAFSEFAIWNYCTNIHDDGLHHEEAANYPTVNIGMTYTTYPVPLQNSPGYPNGYGTCYVQFYPGTDTGTLALTFNGSDSREWTACVILSTAEDSHQFEPLVLSPGNYQGSFKLTHFEDYYCVTLFGANLTEFSSGVAFTYQAKVQPPYELTSQVLTIDSVVYSGGIRGFQYQITNISPLNDVVDVIVWDEQGWITVDTIDHALGTGEDTVFIFDVQIPDGTPLGDTSTIYFAVESWGDPTIIDTQSVLVTAVLQHGDLDFSGEIDISDLVYFVDYAFGGGPAPIPVLEAGDFLCDIGIDISDLVAMVDYMFSGGDPPPCNPY
jgi:hypothetical protein